MMRPPGSGLDGYNARREKKMMPGEKKALQQDARYDKDTRNGSIGGGGYERLAGMTLTSVLGIAGITLSNVGVGKVIQAKRQTVGSREFLEHLSWYSTKPRWGKSNSHAWVPSVMRPPQSPPFPLPLNCSHCFPKKKKFLRSFFSLSRPSPMH